MSAIKIQAATMMLGGQMQEAPVKVLTTGNRIKRMIFVASLYFKMVDIKNPTRDHLVMVNQKFGLAHGGNALLFPAAISGMIWDKVTLVDIFKEYASGKQSAEECIDKVFEQAPKWVKYDAGTLIRQDIKKVFDTVLAG